VRFPCATRQVIVGKSLATGRNDRYFGLVASQDDLSDRRLAAVLHSQDLPGSPAVTMLTDGGDSVRALAGVMAPGAVPILDWFHIAMRLTGLGNYTKGLAHHNPIEATALESRLERIKWRLWHGDAGEALTRAEQLVADVAALDSGYPKLKRLVKATADLATYIANNTAALPDYSERWFNGERISFVESTVNRVVSQRFAKKQQMQWSKQGATCSCRPEPSTAHCATCSPDGIRPWLSTTTKLRLSPLRPEHLPSFDM
jgi:hypothetical protein